ncbi:MAG: NDP-hexose 2,3-dehydratase family protein [Deltaproteobacteria bacterium]|nr:NDP-hexose 2,3-dehydratase family protein [Deltaproteobacteria bacterium]
MSYGVVRGGFFHSSLAHGNRFQPFDEFLAWFHSKLTVGHFSVVRAPLDQLDMWQFEGDRDVLRHTSGRFFRIEGLRVRTTFGSTPTWDQPIINQPEIGILGILTKVFDGVRYFLMQAKMEPGNVNVLQLSPTVQATKSNFSRVHKGKLPAYLEYFVERGKAKVLIDQLQTEQGGRFLRKRNRNIVIEVNDEVPVHDDFKWLTLAELRKLLLIDNFVNMDARSVLSTIPMLDDEQLVRLRHTGIEGVVANGGLSPLGHSIVQSLCDETDGYRTRDEVISWFTEQLVRYELDVQKVPLSQLDGWTISDWEITRGPRFFSVIGVRVEAGSREVARWSQPLIADAHIGLLGFVAKKINGILHLLVQAKVEPGHIDVVELSPTVSCSNYAAVAEQERRPAFFDYFIGARAGKIHLDVLQSEEGGRFLALQNRNMLVEVGEHEAVDVPDNFLWMTLSQITELMRHSMFNIEARSLISGLGFG